MLDEKILAPAITATAAILVPVVGVIASLIARPRTQRKLQNIDILKARLDLMERVVKVGDLVGTTRRIGVDMSSIETEFLRILVDTREAEPARPEDPMEYEMSPFLVRIL